MDTVSPLCSNLSGWAFKGYNSDRSDINRISTGVPACRYQTEVANASASKAGTPLEHAYSAPVKVLRVKPFTEADIATELLQPLPHIQESHREGMRNSIDVRSSMDVHGSSSSTGGQTVMTPLMKSSLGLIEQKKPGATQ